MLALETAAPLMRNSWPVVLRSAPLQPAQFASAKPSTANSPAALPSASFDCRLSHRRGAVLVVAEFQLHP
jgi:hypothetical protein